MYRTETPVWLPRKSILHRIMKSYMLLMFKSADNEWIRSSHTLLDSNFNQASMLKGVEQMVLIHKESSSWRSFDSKAVLLFWRKAKARYVVMSVGMMDLYRRFSSMQVCEEPSQASYNYQTTSPTQVLLCSVRWVFSGTQRRMCSLRAPMLQ